MRWLRPKILWYQPQCYDVKIKNRRSGWRGGLLVAMGGATIVHRECEHKLLVTQRDYRDCLRGCGFRTAL